MLSNIIIDTYLILSTIVEIKICFQIVQVGKCLHQSTIVEIKICFQIWIYTIMYDTSTIVEIKICFQIGKRKR